MKNLAYIAAIVALSACGSKSTDKKTQLEQLKKERTELNTKIAALEKEVGTTTVATVSDVTVLELSEAPFKSYLEVQGRVDAEDNVVINPEMQGVVTNIYVGIGQAVRAGQVVAQIDDNVLRTNIAQLQTNIDLATTVYNRQKNLWDQKIGTEVQFLQAKANKESLEKQKAVLNSQLAMYKIKSPISGTIDQMDLKIGQAVAPGNSGIRVVNASKLKVKALVADSYASKVKQGDAVTVILPDVPDSLNAQLNFASKIIDPVSRSFSVEVRLPSKSTYRPNMLALLRITDYKNDKAITIPVNVIQKAENGSYVFVAENGKAKRVAITTGKVSDGQTEVLSGLKAGDKLVVNGVQNIDEGDSLKF